MGSSLYELLHLCTVRISVPGRSGHGTGFFVAPGRILTCAHVVKAAQPNSDMVEAFWDGQSHPARIMQLVLHADLALLQVDQKDPPCVLLSQEDMPFDHLYSYGYPDDRPGGDPATFTLEGKAGNQEGQLKFKAGQVRPGLSGAPILNVRTCRVCGVIQRTRDRASDLGGRAISATTVFQVFPELEAQQRLFHRKDQRWANALWEYPVRTQQGQNRQRMLKKVRSFWITGVLEQSLHDAVLILLDLAEQPEAIENLWRLVIQESDQAQQPLPPDTTITQVYDHSNGELLILGEPGCGKTTLLLELARDLLDRARLESSHPMPVVFNLSSWAVKRQSLTDWLIEELNLKYQVPRKLGKVWIESDQMLPLLDGLDEVTQAAREACVEAINRYRQEHGSVPTVVCSRSADYLAQTARLHLHRAVVVQPPTEQQISEYLESAGPQLAKLRVARLKDPVLQELAATPLMLSVLTLAYHNIPFEDLLTIGTLERRRQRVFATYVQQMLQRRGGQTHYTPQQTVDWLTWLAWQLVQHSQTEFYLEGMQPDWLLDERLRRLYQGIVGQTSGLVVGLGLGLLGGLLVGLVDGLTFGLVGVLVGVLVVGLVGGLSSERLPKHNLFIPNQGIWRSARNGVLYGLVGGLGFGLVVGLTFGLTSGLTFGLVVGLLLGGRAYIQHFALQFVLWRIGFLPWNYPRFLDYAAEHILLRKVGGGYIFVHRLLLEYLAAQASRSVSDR
jgi:hypothetical protein